MTTQKELKLALGKIREVFDLRSIQLEKVDNRLIEKYYTKSGRGYRFFHSREGSVHMALNFDGNFNKQGYYNQAKVVEKSLKQVKAKNILELGSGKGFNSIYLAKRNEKVAFYGIDLTKEHFKEAKKKGRRVRNLSFIRDDFQSLPFKKESFSLIFEVESVCHALDMEAVLEECFRVLKPGGLFVLFDGFRKTSFKKLDENLKTAAVLVEKSMMVNAFESIDKWTLLAEKVGFKITEKEDISESIIPNLTKFQTLAERYFMHTVLAKIILFFSPTLLVRNSIAGLLMPYTIRENVHGYYKIVLEKPEK